MEQRELTKNEIDTLNKISYSAIANFVAEHQLQEVKNTPYYNKQLKRYGNLYQKELIKQESIFDELEGMNEDLMTHSASNLIEFIQTFVSKGWVNFRDWQQVYMAFTMDPKSMLKATEEVLTNPELNK